MNKKLRINLGNSWWNLKTDLKWVIKDFISVSIYILLIVIDKIEDILNKRYI